MMIETHNTQLWIDGPEIAAMSGETFPVLDPGRGEKIAYAAPGTQQDVDRAASWSSANRMGARPNQHPIEMRSYLSTRRSTKTRNVCNLSCQSI